MTSAQATVDTLTSDNEAAVLSNAAAKVDTAKSNVTDAQNTVTAAEKIVPTFTADEIATINARNATYAKLEAATKAIDNIYAVEPQTSADGTFVPGKLTDTALQNAVDWLNYYRGLFGLSSVTADSALTTQAQITAAVETALETISHYLKTDGSVQPANVSDADWNAAIEGAGSSNLSSVGGVSSELKELMYGWLLDNYNLMGGAASVGHRQTMLNPTSTAIGFGTAIGDSALTMNNDGSGKWPWDANPTTETINFPAVNLFPASIVESGIKWSVDFGAVSSYSSAKISNVTVKNLTTGKTITIAQDELIDTSVYSRNGNSSVAFNVDDSIGIQAGDKYQVSVATDQGTYSYTFKLYDDSKQYTADDTLAKATAALATAQAALTDAQTAYNNVKTQYADKATVLETAQATLTQAKSKLAKDEKSLANAQSANKAAQAKLTQAQAAVQSANDALTAAKTAQVQTQANYDAAITALAGQDSVTAKKAAQTAVADAQAALASAQSQLDQATQVATTANGALKQAQTKADQSTATATAAADALTKSEVAAKDAADALAAFPTLEQAQANLAQAQAAVTDAQAKYSTALEALSIANDANNDAQAVLNEAKAALTTAEQNLAAAEAIVTQVGAQAQAKLDAQTQKNAALAQRAAFNRQLDAVVQAKSNPTTLGTTATSVKATTSNTPAAAQKTLPQTGNREAVYLEVLGLVLGMFGLVGISRRRED